MTNEIPYAQLLDDTNQLIQVSDADTLTMVYANKTARDFAKNDLPFEGMPCYKYMMGLDAQCPFCPMLKMQPTDDEYITEIDNGKQVYTVKTKRIMYGGKKAFIEYATDVTTIRRAQQIFESQMQMLIKSIPEAQGIFHVNLTQDKWLSSNGVSSNIERIKDLSSVDELVKQISSYIPDMEERVQFNAAFSKYALFTAYTNGKTEVEKDVLSYYDDGSIRWARITARLIMNPNTGDLEAIIYGMDITDEKRYFEQAMAVEREKEALIKKSQLDMLTGAYSKRAFEQLSSEYIKNYPHQPFAVLFIDLDNFKTVNDVFGHLMGDKVIINVAEKLQTIFSNKDIVSRFGGDEFCVLVKNIPYEKLIDKVEFAIEKLRMTYSECGADIEVSSSIGVAYCKGNATDVQTWQQKADTALYEAKRGGRNQYKMAE